MTRKITPKDLRITALYSTVFGILIIFIGLILHHYIGSEEFSFGLNILLPAGIILSIEGIIKLLTHKHTINKILSEADPEKVYEISEDTDDISDELYTQIITDHYKAKTEKNDVTPKHRRGNAYIVIYIGFFLLLMFIGSITHENGFTQSAFVFLAVINFLFIFAIKLLYTQKEYALKYFKKKNFANPLSATGEEFEDNTEEYLEDLEKQEESKSIVNTIIFVLITLFNLGAFSAYIRSQTFLIVSAGIFLIVFAILKKNELYKYILTELFKEDNIEIIFVKLKLMFLTFWGLINLTLSIFLIAYAIKEFNSYTPLLSHPTIAYIISPINLALFIIITVYFVKLRKKFIGMKNE